MTEVYEYGGICRRVCPVCGTEIEVERPSRAISQHSTRAQRHAYSSELRRQILWEATCDGSPWVSDLLEWRRAASGNRTSGQQMIRESLASAMSARCVVASAKGTRCVH